MTTRFPLVAITLVICAALPASGEVPSPETICVLWSKDAESPGVPVEKPGWYVSVVPESVSIDGLESVLLRCGSAQTDARVLYCDSDQRLCLLQAGEAFPEKTTFFEIRNAVDTKAGQKLECLSDKSACLTTVAGKDWSYQGETFPMPFLRVRVSDPDHFCKAGTPLVTTDGKLAGLLTISGVDGNGGAFAIPVSRIRKMVEDVKRFKRSGPVWVGLIFHNHSSTPEVVEVKRESPAEMGGLLRGDVILSVNDEEIESLNDLVETIQTLPAGTEAHLRVLRGLSEQELKVTPRFAEISAASR